MLSSYEVSLNYDETSIYIISESWGIHSSQCQSPGFYTKHTNPALSRYWTWWVRWALHCNIHTRFMIDNKLGMCLFYDCSCMLHILSYSTSSCPVRIVGAPLRASFSSFFHLSLHVLHSPLGSLVKSNPVHYVFDVVCPPLLLSISSSPASHCT